MTTDTPANILIVDDEDTVRELLSMILDQPEYNIDTAADLSEAMTKCRTSSVDLMLLDKNLPDGSGLDLVIKLRAEGIDCAVVMMSAFASFAVAEEAMKYGVKEFLVKPFEDIDDVTACVRRVLAKR